jgi:hypothetical protein
MSERDLPQKDMPLNCSFQRRDKGAKTIECALTERGQSNPLYTMVDRDDCLIDICPLFQGWKLNKEIRSLLEK